MFLKRHIYVHAQLAQLFKKKYIFSSELKLIHQNPLGSFFVYCIFFTIYSSLCEAPHLCSCTMLPKPYNENLFA